MARKLSRSMYIYGHQFNQHLNLHLNIIEHAISIKVNIHFEASCAN